MSAGEVKKNPFCRFEGVADFCDHHLEVKRLDHQMSVHNRGQITATLLCVARLHRGNRRELRSKKRKRKNNTIVVSRVVLRMCVPTLICSSTCEGIRIYLEHLSGRIDGVQLPPFNSVVPQTPTTSASFIVLRSKFGSSLGVLDEASKLHFQKLANAAEKAFADRAILFDENKILTDQNNEKNVRDSTRRRIVGEDYE